MADDNVCLHANDFDTIMKISFKEVLLDFLIVHHDCKKQAEWQCNCRKFNIPLNTINTNNIKYQKCKLPVLMNRIKYYKHDNYKLTDLEQKFKRSVCQVENPDVMFQRVSDFLTDKTSDSITQVKPKSKSVTWTDQKVQAPNTPPASPPPHVQHGGRSFIVYKKQNRKYIKPGGKIVYI